MDIDRIRYWGQVIFKGNWTEKESEQCSEDILKEGKLEGLKEFLDFLEHEMNWSDMNEYHEIMDNKMNELREKVRKTKSEGRKR